MIITKPQNYRHIAQTIWPVILGLIFLPFFEIVQAQQIESGEFAFPKQVDSATPLDNQQVQDGWIALFDGHSFFGWRPPSESDWKVEGGLIIADQAMAGMLRTASQFDDFQLLLEYQANPEGTSEGGSTLYLRTSPSPSVGDAIAINLVQSGNETSWTHLLVSIDGNDVRVSIDGVAMDVPIQENLASMVQRGYIGLNCQSGNLRVRKLLLRPLSMPAQSFDDWQSSSENEFRASVQEGGEIVLTGGPGFVESEKQYENFVLQTWCSISPGGNSGVFYRCIPGENTNGYESQIDNSKVDGDFQRPANCGTGGIFRRKDARQIIAEDESWFAKTIVAEGPHVAVWVNGYQVTDWTDKRERNKNPRRGLRTEQGTLMLQGHDAETTTRFRELKVREIRDRR